MSRLRQQLAAAHQEVRDLKNAAVAKEHAISDSLRPLELRLAAEERANAALRLEVENLRASDAERSQLSDGELVALAAIVITESLPATAARQRLEQELRCRRVLPRK